MNSPEVTLESRQQAKIKYQQQFNSILQMREDYFKNRNVKENFSTMPKIEELTQQQMKKFNIQQGSPREKKKRSKRMNKRESDF